MKPQDRAFACVVLGILMLGVAHFLPEGWSGWYHAMAIIFAVLAVLATFGPWNRK